MSFIGSKIASRRCEFNTTKNSTVLHIPTSQVEPAKSFSPTNWRFCGIIFDHSVIQIVHIVEGDDKCNLEKNHADQIPIGISSGKVGKNLRLYL